MCLAQQVKAATASCFSFLWVWAEVLGSGVGHRLWACIFSFSSPRASGTKSAVSLIPSRNTRHQLCFSRNKTQIIHPQRDRQANRMFLKGHFVLSNCSSSRELCCHLFAVFPEVYHYHFFFFLLVVRRGCFDICPSERAEASSQCTPRSASAPAGTHACNIFTAPSPGGAGGDGGRWEPVREAHPRSSLGATIRATPTPQPRFSA